jgi:hypothetical protein
MTFQKAGACRPRIVVTTGIFTPTLELVNIWIYNHEGARLRRKPLGQCNIQTENLAIWDPILICHTGREAFICFQPLNGYKYMIF